jgi:diguanylate cyclase (GGDEF)-like protein
MVHPWLAALLGFVVTFGFLVGTLVADAKAREAARINETQTVLEILAARTQERVGAYLGLLRLLRDETVTGGTLDVEFYSRGAQAIVQEFGAYQALTAINSAGVIVDIVPLDGNESALGLDILQVPDARLALEYARETGEMGVTAPLSLAQGGRGFVVYIPVGRPPGSAGFVSAVFRSGTFFEPLLSDSLRSGYALRVTDEGSELFRYSAHVSNTPVISTRVSIGSRDWVLELTPNATMTSGFLNVTQAMAIAFFAAVGIAILLARLAAGATREIESRAEAWRIAHTNTLTGLPNRYSLMKALAAINDDGWNPFDLFLIDITQLRLINAVHGQGIADKVILWVSARLLESGDDQFVFHLGGGEFALLVKDSKRREANERAVRLQQLVNQHVDLGDVELDIGGQVGFVHAGRQLPEAESLNRAGTALVLSKEHGGPQAYDDRVREDVQTRAFMEGELRLALEREQLRLHFQPISRLDSPEPATVGFEALLRWEHPELGPVRPDVFIPLAEETGCIEDIGRWVMLQACRQLAQWSEEGRNYRVGVNLSPRQMLDRGLAEDIQDALAQTGAPAELLIIEVTESLAIRNLDSAVELLSRLRALGISIALDDFGTGYSSLNYLNRLPINIVKLDRVLIADIDKSAQPLEIARGMIALAHAIGLQVVAEGVETHEQLALLRSMHCDFAQGYHFSRPLPVEEIERTFNAA